MNAEAPASMGLAIPPAKDTILVLSGKGGVGKSTVAANLAVSLSLQGFSTGLLDTDFHGPSIPRLLGLEGATLSMENGKILPAEMGALKVLSIDFMLSNRTDPVIWRGPMKMNIIRQLLEDVNWDDPDFLVVDCPPGTGDEPLSVVQLVPAPTGAVIVTTPQDLSIDDVKRSIQFCKALELPVLGVIENMAEFICPHCGESTELFGKPGGRAMSEEMDVPFLGSLPFDRSVASSGDAGKPFIYFDGNSPTAKKFESMVGHILEVVRG